MSTCSGLAALDLANSRNSKGLRVTGVGASVCARQGCIRPLGLGDLQKGERYALFNSVNSLFHRPLPSSYCNMDYVIFSSIKSCGLRGVLISYDIYCQWMKKLWSRHSSLPPAIQAAPTIKFEGVIPKFHLPSHKLGCQTKFSLNLRPGAGRTDGEGIERDWANINPAATSTKEMGEGARHDTIDDLFGDWNYRKITGLGAWLLYLHRSLINFTLLGSSLKDKRDAAITASQTHAEQFQLFSAGFSADKVAEWDAMVSAWEADDMQPDPYVVTASCKPTLVSFLIDY